MVERGKSHAHRRVRVEARVRLGRHKTFVSNAKAMTFDPPRQTSCVGPNSKDPVSKVCVGPKEKIRWQASSATMARRRAIHVTSALGWLAGLATSPSSHKRTMEGPVGRPSDGEHKHDACFDSSTCAFDEAGRIPNGRIRLALVEAGDSQDGRTVKTSSLRLSAFCPRSPVASRGEAAYQ
jgi:hypothetical protein